MYFFLMRVRPGTESGHGLQPMPGQVEPDLVLLGQLAGDAEFVEQCVEPHAMQCIEVGPRQFAGAHPVHRRGIGAAPLVGELLPVDAGDPLLRAQCLRRRRSPPSANRRPCRTRHAPVPGFRSFEAPSEKPCCRRHIAKAGYASGRIRMRPGSMTEKWPTQSARDASSCTKRAPTSPGFGIGIRNSTTPHAAGRADALANSPKSLSKVRRTRCSRTAHSRTTASLTPGATSLTETISCPAASSAATAVPGKFSLARNRISRRAGKRLLRTDRVPRIDEAGDYVVVSNARIICQNFRLAPSIGHQPDHEFNRQPRSAYHWLAQSALPDRV